LNVMSLSLRKTAPLLIISALYCQTADAAEASGTGGFLNMALQSIAALAAVLGLFAVVVWVMRRFQGLPPHAKAGNNLRIVQRLSLGGKHSLAIVACGQEQWLIALSPNSITQLSRLRETAPGGEEENSLP